MRRPQSLAALLVWYRGEVSDAIPQRIHSRDFANDGSHQWHGAFRAWLTAHPAAENSEGELLSPLRFWLWRLGGNRARYLYMLGYLSGDWVAAGNLKGIADMDVAHDYTRECLRRLHQLMYADDGTPCVPRRAVRRDCAEPGCPNKTTRLRCAAHELGGTTSD